MRTFQQMLNEAMVIRLNLLRLDKDPSDQEFFVSEEEMRAIRNEAEFSIPLGGQFKKICGLQLRVAGNGEDSRE